MTSLVLAAASTAPPAGGAAIDQIVIATLGAIIVTVALLWLGLGHRSRRVPHLGRLAAFSQRVSGLPGWVALPSAIATVALVTAVFGMYWDISLHIDQGRDEGPLANPAHYFILAGLYGIFSAGVVAILLPRGKPSASAVRITRDLHAPLGGVLLTACGGFALIGFPLDDVWHRLFGQDVTLWGPTHLMLIGGASMTLLGIAVLMVEGLRANVAAGQGTREQSWITKLRLIALTGGLLLGLSTFQAEFDFGVPQFRFVFAPMLIMLAAGVGLVAARLWLGRGAALGAVAFFLVVRGTLALLVGPILGESTPHFPLYIAEAAIVEVVALLVARDRPLAFGAWCGVLIGTVGLAAEWGWSHIWSPLPWPAELLPEAAILGFGMAVAGSLLGAWIGARLASDTLPRTRSLRSAAVVAATVVTGLVAFSLLTPDDQGIRGTVTLTNVQGGPDRTAMATVRLDPPGAGQDADWLTVTAWQGGGLVVDRLARVAPGVYRTNKAIPVSGDWKTVIRLHDGNSLLGLPVYLPEDGAIPAKEVAARSSFTRAFVPDHQILQRESKASGGAITLLAYLVVIAVALSLLALLAWGLHRLALASPREGDRRDRAASRAASPAGAGRPAVAAR